MEYLEAPSIASVERKHVYPFVKWLDKAKFVEYLALSRTNPDYQIRPFGVDSLSGEDETAAGGSGGGQRRIYIGKSIPSQQEGVRYYGWGDAERLELIGTVAQDLTSNEWELHVPYASGVHVIRKDFLVLCLADPDSFYWQPASKAAIPPNALRGSIENEVCEYMYIGRNRPDSVGFYFRTGWSQFTEPGRTPVGFGKVHVGHEGLYVPLADKEVKFSHYDILCLKPSPAPLKSLCTHRIRRLVDNSQEKLKSINKNASGARYLPQPLIDSLLKFPSYLKVGDYLLKGEKLVSDDDEYELVIKNNGQLVCQSVLNAEKMARMGPEEKQALRDQQIVSIVASSVNSIWLHRFKVIFNLNNDKVLLFRSFFNRSPEYSLVVRSHVSKPMLDVISDEDGGSVGVGYGVYGGYGYENESESDEEQRDYE